MSAEGGMAALPSLLSEPAVRAFLDECTAWRRVEHAIEREFEFGSFEAAVRFVNSVAQAAEEMDHHPDIDIRFRRVRVILSTHSAGGITKLDLQMARLADERARAIT